MLKDFEGYIERMQEIRLLSKPDLEEIDAHLSEVLTNLLVDDIEYLLSEAREGLYRDTYDLIKKQGR